MSSLIREVSTNYNHVIRQGLVPLERHPHFEDISTELLQQGVDLVMREQGAASIRKERKIDRNAEESDTFVLSIASNDLYINLEYALQHVDQILERFLAQGLPIFTAVWQEDEQGQWQKDTSYPGVLRGWQNTIAEYHARLQEFKRLHQRGVNETVLIQHAKQLQLIEIKYLNATGSGASKRKQFWENIFFSDLPALRDEVNQLLTSEISAQKSIALEL